MSKLRFAVVAVALGATTFAGAAPANAESVHTSCSPPSDHSLTLNGTAFFVSVNGGVNHSWFQYNYTLGGNMGSHSNVNIRLYENDQLRFQDLSPDNRDTGSYIVKPFDPTVLPASSSERVFFEAIFDRFGYDPRCLASTAPV